MNNNTENWEEVCFGSLAPEDATSSVVLLADGKYYSVESLASKMDFSRVCRYERDGKLDHTFGKGGAVELPWPAAYPYKWSVSLQGESLMVSCLAGTNEWGMLYFALYKLDAKTGARDEVFGIKLVEFPDGLKLDVLSKDARISLDQTPQLPDGKHRQSISYGMAQFELSGKLDQSFAGTGMIRGFPKTLYDYRTQHIAPYTVAGEFAGFLMCGSFMLGGFSRGWVGAIDNQGKVLQAFGTDGETHFMRLPENELTHLVVRSLAQVGDHIYVVGFGVGLPKTSFMYRLTNDGKIDGAYNNGDPVFLESGKTSAFHLAADGDGMLIGVSGVASAGAVYRVDASGKLDTAFGGRGWLNMPTKYTDPAAIKVTEHAGSRFLEVWGHGYLLRHPLL
ncbi:hypothetical protein D3C81_856610 [compost metagenome]